MKKEPKPFKENAEALIARQRNAVARPKPNRGDPDEQTKPLPIPEPKLFDDYE